MLILKKYIAIHTLYLKYSVHCTPFLLQLKLSIQEHANCYSFNSNNNII